MFGHRREGEDGEGIGRRREGGTLVMYICYDE